MMAHLVTATLARLADLNEVVSTISQFAEFCVTTALAHVQPCWRGPTIGEATASRNR